MLSFSIAILPVSIEILSFSITTPPYHRGGRGGAFSIEILSAAPRN